MKRCSKRIVRASAGWRARDGSPRQMTRRGQRKPASPVPTQKGLMHAGAGKSGAAQLPAQTMCGLRMGGELISRQSSGDDNEMRASQRDRKSTRLNSSHGYISYAVFCLKKKITKRNINTTDPEC